MQKITISHKASDGKGNVRRPENMGFLAPKKNSFTDPIDISAEKTAILLGREKQ